MNEPEPNRASRREAIRQSAQRRDLFWMFGAVVIAVVLGVGTGVGVAVVQSRRIVATEQRDIARNCATGQRSWDVLSKVIHAAYESPQIPNIDPKTLPPRTQQLLLDLAPLLTDTSNGKPSASEQRVLAQLGDRPQC